MKDVFPRDERYRKTASMILDYMIEKNGLKTNQSGEFCRTNNIPSWEYQYIMKMLSSHDIICKEGSGTDKSYKVNKSKIIEYRLAFEEVEMLLN